MTYYEELGVRADATTEEIRQAYRSLARLLHPDQQQDAELKQAAERQMRRLNEMLELLTDAASRRAYDRSLAIERAAPLVVVAAPRFTKRGWSPGRGMAAAARGWHWALIAVTGAGLAGWYLTEQPRGAPGGPPPAKENRAVSARAVAPPGGRPAGETGRPQSPAHRKGDKPGEEKQRALPPAAIDSPPAAGASEPALTDAETPPALPQPLVAPSDPPQAAPAAGFTAATEEPKKDIAPQQDGLRGLWLYVPGSPDEGPELRYRPVFIEMTVAQEHPKLRGKYRARYEVPDEAVSSEISFQFEGDGSDGRIRWESAEGRRGEGVLKRLSTDSLQMNWWTTVSGGEAQLASGSAVLVRQRVR